MISYLSDRLESIDSACCALPCLGVSGKMAQDAMANAALAAIRKTVVASIGVLFLFADPVLLSAQEQKIIVVVGAHGNEEYGKQFEAWADNWQSAIESAPEPVPLVVRIGSGESDVDDATRLKNEIALAQENVSELWVVLIGHGTNDRKRSKFNLRGPDVSANELDSWLAPLPCRTVVVNCSSASGEFISVLKKKNRVVVTATKSGAQHNYSRFGGFLSQSISDPAFDLDKDQATSLLEAFLAASAQTQDFYSEQARLATELAMIDDNHDGRGTPADWFQGTRVVRKSKTGETDGLLANQIFLIPGGVEFPLSEAQRQTRDRLERSLEALRLQKSTMTEEGFYQTIEPIMLELAEIYRAAADSSN